MTIEASCGTQMSGSGCGNRRSRKLGNLGASIPEGGDGRGRFRRSHIGGSYEGLPWDYLSPVRMYSAPGSEALAAKLVEVTKPT
jgi:hypothetical protein